MRIGRAGLVALVVLGLLVVSVGVYLLDPQEPPTTAPRGDDAVPLRTGEVPASAEPARVVSHVDGDTIRLTGGGGSALLPGDETTVRLLEIDTPEHARDGQAEECWADEASAALREWLPVGAEVWVERDRDLHDPYDRTLLYLWTPAGELVNLSLVRDGHARAVLFEPNDAHIEVMRAAEAEARAAGRGLWGACR